MVFCFVSSQGVEDVNVTFEDQQKINKFARNTNRMTELKDEIEAKKVRHHHQACLLLHGLDRTCLVQK